MIDSCNGFATLDSMITTFTGLNNGSVTIEFVPVPDHGSTIALLSASFGLLLVARRLYA